MTAGAERIYQQRGFVARHRLSLGILALSFLYGVWELVASFIWPDSANSALFGVLFIGAAFYGGARLMKDSGDTIVALDRDPSARRLVVSLWRPWGTKTIAGPEEAFVNWRFYVSVAKRGQAMPQLRVEHAGYPRPLVIELVSGMDLAGLRQVAPEAVGEYEERIAPKAA